MQPDTVLTLGNFEFARYEIPEHIPFGGDQRLVMHELVGGIRVIDAMGRSDAPLEWSGLFQGKTALARARYLNGRRIAGQSLILTWDEFMFEVVIASFTADYQRFYQVPYRICCTVLQDLSNPVKSVANAGIDDMIDKDRAEANALGGLIGDSPLSGALGTLDSAIKSVSSFATATQSTINSVLQPLAAVQSRVKVLIGSVSNTIGNVTTLGGIMPNNPIAKQAAKLTTHVSAMTQLPRLYNLQSVLGRMGGNLGSIGGGGNSVTQTGGNLYGLASKAYGDATAWPTIAKANKLSDPQLTGINTITIPDKPDDSGGVFYA